jgi:hypothetical protein
MGRQTFALGDPPPSPSPVEIKIAADREARENGAVMWVTRDEAMCDSVVNRSRDLICGTFARLPFTRKRTYGPDVDRDLGPGWLNKPDPDHTRGYFVAGVTDDLFFRGYAYAWKTAYDGDGFPMAAKWLPFEQLTPWPDGEGVTFYDAQADLLPGLWAVGTHRAIDIPRRDLIVFESPLDGLLCHGGPVLSTASRLTASANRFAAAEFAAGWLKQVEGEPLDAADAQLLVDTWASNRRRSAIGYLSEVVEYHESQLQPDTLQLVEGRSYQDNAVARLCNLPAYTVGASVPGDTMTYKTAGTARLDTYDFGLAPFASAWSQALSDETVTPRGTLVDFDLEPFLRTSTLAALPEAAPTPPGVPNDASV